MSRPRKTIPTFSIDRTGRAFTKVNGKFISLGRADDPESRMRYAAILQRHAQGLPVTPEQPKAARQPAELSVNELCLAFMLHAEAEYRDPRTGKPNAEYQCYRSAIRPLRELFGETHAADFGPNSLRIVRQKFIELDWSRGFINKAVSRVRHIFKWAVAREMFCKGVGAAVLAELQTLEPLKAGKTTARETKRRQAVPQADIDAVKARLRQRNRDLLQLLLLCGARPAELLSIRTCDIDRSAAVWKAEIKQHKNAHRGLSRALYFGPQAQLILARYLRVDDRQARLFPSNGETFTKAIRAACVRAGVPGFSAYHLRHTAITAVRDELGIEAAQAIAGHARPDMTAHYGAKMDTLAAQTAAKCG